MHMLDTSIAIRLRDGDADVEASIAGLSDEIVLSVVTRVELEGGVWRDAADAPFRRLRLDSLLRALPTLPFNEAAADAYRAILQTLGYSRRKVLDRMIAAQALVHGATLVTANADDFKDVPGLRLLTW